MRTGAMGVFPALTLILASSAACDKILGITDFGPGKDGGAMDASTGEGGETDATTDSGSTGPNDSASANDSNMVVDTGGGECGSPDDPHNCGLCHYDCGDAGCTNSMCNPTTFAATPSAYRPMGVAVSAGVVYWVEAVPKTSMGPQGGQIRAMPENPDGGTTPSILWSSDAGWPSGALAVDSTGVYWPHVSPSGSQVMHMGLDGSNPQPLVSSLNQPGAIAKDANNVYVTDVGSCTMTSCPSGAVLQLPLDGGAPVSLASSQSFVESLAIDSNSVYWSAVQNGLPPGSGGAIYTTPIGQPAGPAPASLPGTGTRDVTFGATGGSVNFNLFGLAAASFQGSFTVFGTFGGGAGAGLCAGGLLSSSRTPPQSNQLATGTIPFAVALDHANVYWTDQGCSDGSGRTVAVQPSGGTATFVLAQATGASGTPTAIAVGAAGVYWTEEVGMGGGSLLRVPKLP